MAAFTVGQKLRASNLQTNGPLPQGVAAYGVRGTSSSTTTTEIGVLRIDGITVVSTRLYRIWTPQFFLTSSVNNDVVSARIRYNTAGTATTGSTQLGQDWRSKIVDNTQPPSGTVSGILSGVSGTLSVILTIGRTAGTGNAQILNGSTLVVEDIGADPGNTGISL